MPDTASQSYILIALIAQESVERTRAVVEDTRQIVDGSLRAIAKSRELIEKLSGTAELARQGKVSQAPFQDATTQDSRWPAGVVARWATSYGLSIARGGLHERLTNGRPCRQTPGPKNVTASGVERTGRMSA